MAEENKSGVAISIPAPEKFSFIPAEWEKWKARFMRYMSISGNNERKCEDKINCLLYCMGEKAEDILKQFDKKLSYEKLIGSFDDFFTPKKNVIYERFKFNSRFQTPNEKFDDFLTDLYMLAENCEYGELKEELIRDRVIIGIKDKKTSERLQLKNNLLLKDAIIICKQAEIQTEESVIFSQDIQVGEINRIKQYCWFCGGERHPKDKCPASKSKCFKCGRSGHFAKKCRNKSMMRLLEDKEDKKDVSVFQVGSCKKVDKYLIDIKIYNNQTFIGKVDFLIDTGADITAIPLSDLTQNIPITTSDNIVKGPDGNRLSVVGIIHLRLVHKSREYVGKVYVIKGLECAILGRPSIDAMNIISIHSISTSANTNEIEMSTVDVHKEYPNIFNELGVFKDEFHIKLIENPQYFIQATPRNVSIPLLPRVKEELDRLEKLEIISPIEEPTEFVSPIVVVLKNDKVRICGDYTKVNQNILRPVYPIPKVENTLGQLKGAKYFSKIDATSGFHQIRLDEESKKLTTIITPFGRYVYNRLPFGLNCAPEYFSMKFSNLFKGLNVVIHMDDLLIFEQTIENHDRVLREVLSRLEREGITINKNKCIFGKTEVSFLGHIINKEGIRPDPERIKAINGFKTPTNKKEVLQFLGMINFVGRFIPNKSHILEPLHALLKESNLFIWGMRQEKAFKEIKNLLRGACTLAHFDPNSKVIVSADSSSYGLGAALMQEDQWGQRSVVAYASRTLTDTEKHYAQIEKESLALVWAVEKFRDFVVGIHIQLETDHKPLLQILQTKPLNDLSPRLLRFRLKLMRFDYDVKYIPGKCLAVADALSRHPLPFIDSQKNNCIKGVAYINICPNETVTKESLYKINFEQNKCNTCVKLKEFTVKGWPSKNKIPDFLKKYYQYRYNFSIEENLLLYNSRIVIPETLQKEILTKIHEGHFGITKCRERAKQSVWWEGLSKQIEEIVKNCPRCIETRRNNKEEMLVEEIPDRPWQKIGIDLFKFKNGWFLVMIDYFSRFFEILKLKDLTEDSVIIRCKEVFSRYGIPEIVRSDCGTQFKSKFNGFAREYGFRLITSSPYYSQSNGQAESGVKIAKSLLEKNDDIYLALLVYRNTPLESGYSPAELMFNRKLRDNLPMLSSKLNTSVTIGDNFRKSRQEKKIKDALNYNKRHKATNLKELNIGDNVWISDLKMYGKILSKCQEPRSFIVETDKGKFRRNRWHLISSTESTTLSSGVHPLDEDNIECASSFEEELQNEQGFNTNQEEIVATSNIIDKERELSKRVVNKPKYLDDYILT